MHQRATRRRTRRAPVGNLAYGVAFLTVLVLLVGLAVASFQQRFTPVVMASLLTDRIGNQLQEGADVKVRGLIVGEVRSISTRGSGARLELALQPDQVGAIPANVSARLLPKTLFGERYVDLVLPDRPSSHHLSQGDTIPQDRSKSAIELEQVFQDLLPMLRAVRPADLAATLNALATSLEGRGERLGKNLVNLDAYLTRFNPSLPALKQDISGLADVASLYADAAPDLLRMARNLAVTNHTIVEKQASLASFLTGTTSFANTATQVLDENDDRIIRLGDVSRPVLGVIAKYAPTYPCMAESLTRYRDNLNRAFAGGMLHITLEVVKPRAAYTPDEAPQYLEHRGPHCFGLPNVPSTQAHPYVVPQPPARDGTKGDGYTSYSAIPGIGLAGTAQEQSLTDALFAPQMGISPDAMPDISNLLLGPLARGTVVSEQ